MYTILCAFVKSVCGGAVRYTGSSHILCPNNSILMCVCVCVYMQHVCVCVCVCVYLRQCWYSKILCLKCASPWPGTDQIVPGSRMASSVSLHFPLCVRLPCYTNMAVAGWGLVLRCVLTTTVLVGRTW